MKILTIRTDRPEAEIGLYQDAEQLAYQTWPAHRQLAETIHARIADLLNQQNLELKDLQGLAAYKGPGSFTGLRIGLSVANALADGLRIAIVGRDGQNWLEQSINDLLAGQNERQVLPEYGAPPHITAPKK